MSLEDLFMIVWEQTNHYFSAVLYGKLLLPEYSPQLDQGIMFGTQPDSPKHHRSIMRLPKQPTERYQCAVHQEDDLCFFNSDAVLLSKPNQSVAFATSDCGATILYTKDTNDVVLAHTGRNQLMASDRSHERVSILAACISLLRERGAAPENILSLSVSQISAINFPHQGHPDEALVRSQADLWGDCILPNPEAATLDLVTLIMLQLCHYGIPRSNITRVRINPYSSPDLASKRAGKLGSNVIMVTRPAFLAHAP
jgi:copper oxidase (laccase) domain-containing protein